MARALGGGLGIRPIVVLGGLVWMGLDILWLANSSVRTSDLDWGGIWNRSSEMFMIE